MGVPSLGKYRDKDTWGKGSCRVPWPHTVVVRTPGEWDSAGSYEERPASWFLDLLETGGSVKQLPQFSQEETGLMISLNFLSCLEGKRGPTQRSH